MHVMNNIREVTRLHLLDYFQSRVTTAARMSDIATAAAVTATEEARQKVDQLQLVFSKAMDVTFESLGPNDIRNCFGELRSVFGNSLDGKLLQQLALSKNRLQGEFEGLCAKHDLVREIAAVTEHNHEIQSLNSARNESGGEEGSAVQATLSALRSVELQEMTRLVQELEKENAQLLENRRIMSQKINEQIAAIEEEESKMKSVVDQL